VADYPRRINPGDDLMRHPFEIVEDRKGATAVEYGLILALIFLAMVVGVVAVGTSTSDLWGNVSNQVKNA
jgi:pilus assembly protein Flp/PilA